LYVLADRDVKNVIESASGVGDVGIRGARPSGANQLGGRRLAAHRLSVMQVREALARQNAEIPADWSTPVAES